MHDTVQEGIEEALEKQDAIDKIQSTQHRTTEHLEDKKTIEAGKIEIQKKIEKEYKRKLLTTQQARNFIEQRMQDEGRGLKALGVVEAEELQKNVAATMPQKELTEEERDQLVIDYLDEVMQLSEFWTGRMETPDEKPKKEEIELLEKRKFHGIMGYLIRNRSTGKKFFIADLHSLNKNIADKLPAALKMNFKRYHIS